MDKKKIIVVIFFILIFIGVFISAQETEDYISSFVEKQGIEKNSIKNISEINRSSFPKQILISNIEENNVGIYEVEYSEEGIDRNLFVLSYGTQEIEEAETSFMEGNYNYLTFEGQEGIIGEYLMVDYGSIVGFSSSVSFSGVGKVGIEIYKNGNPLGLLNEIYSEGTNYDYELQSENINLFYPGDIISVFVNSNNLNIQEVNSIVKVKIY